MNSFKTIKAPSEGIYKEKGSKFIAFAIPIISEYLKSLVSKLISIGIKAPLHIMQSNGGILKSETVIKKPAKTNGMAINKDSPLLRWGKGGFISALHIINHNKKVHQKTMFFYWNIDSQYNTTKILHFDF